MTQNVNVAISNMETARSNRVKEAETYRHNLAVEAEERRQNMERERHNVSVLLEQQRHSMATEFQARADLRERERAARATEALRSSELTEQRRHNVATEVITNLNNLRTYNMRSRELETRKDELAEAVRAHKQSERLSERGHDIQLLNVRGNLEARHDELEQNLLLRSRELDIRAQDSAWQHQDRVGNLEIGAYNAKTKRIEGFLNNLTRLLTVGNNERRKW